MRIYEVDVGRGENADWLFSPERTLLTFIVVLLHSLFECINAHVCYRTRTMLYDIIMFVSRRNIHYLIITFVCRYVIYYYV